MIEIPPCKGNFVNIRKQVMNLPLLAFFKNELLKITLYLISIRDFESGFDWHLIEVRVLEKYSGD